CDVMQRKAISLPSAGAPQNSTITVSPAGLGIASQHDIRTETSRAVELCMNKMKLVMVGNGMAGVRTIEELLRVAPDLYDITVFGAEPHPNYNRIMLSPVLAGEQTVDDIILNPLSWYAD